jgi:ATP-dependent DNA ligase
MERRATGVRHRRLRSERRHGRFDPGRILQGQHLMYAGRIRAGIPAEFRRVLFPHFEELRIERCPFRNLPDGTEGRWGEGLTAAKMVICRWLDPFIVARIEFLEWTPENRLRHPRFAGIRSDKDAREVVRE